MPRAISKDVAPALARAWTVVGVGLLILVVLEGVASASFRFRDTRKQAAFNREQMAEVHPGQDWAQACFEEQLTVPLRWHPYLYWRRAAFRGRCVNIDEGGLRRTWNRAPAPSSADHKIFMFGGSGMWGYGARDEFTIPSLVSRVLGESGAENVWVVNFADFGYVSTQGVIALMLELRRGHVPDVAVFYDGVNDVTSAIQSGVAGLPQNEANRVAEFNLRRRVNLRGFVEGLALFRVVQTIPTARARRAEPDPHLTAAVVDVYLSNVRIVQALARQYGFSALFFWQPSVFYKRRLSAWEKQLTQRRRRWFPGATDPAMHYVGARRVLQERIERGDAPGVHDLAAIFDDHDETVFIDPVHISERGNAKVAAVIGQAIRELFGARR